MNILGRQLLRTAKILPKIRSENGIHRWVAPTLKELKRRKNKAQPEPFRKRSDFLEWNYDAEIFAFGKRLNETFDQDLLKKALVHKSYITSAQKLSDKQDISQEDNSKLIEDGKNIIETYLKKVLHTKYSQDPAEALFNYLNSENVLAHVAKHIGLEDLILTEEIPVANETLMSTFQAVIAVLNESSGLEKTELFLNDFLLSQLHDKDIFDVWTLEKPYEYLSDIMKEKGVNLEPRLCNQSATNTILANFQVGLYSNKNLISLGWGESIDIAKDMAALNAIEKNHLK